MASPAELAQFAKALAEVTAAPDYCFFKMQWACMPRSDWSSWIQAIGSIAAIIGSAWIASTQIRAARKDQNTTVALRYEAIAALFERIKDNARGALEDRIDFVVGTSKDPVLYFEKFNDAVRMVNDLNVLDIPGERAVEVILKLKAVLPKLKNLSGLQTATLTPKDDRAEMIEIAKFMDTQIKLLRKEAGRWRG